MNNSQTTANKKIDTQDIQEKNLNFLDLAGKVLFSFDKRSQEIVQKRFGLVSKKEETLEKIGDHFSITRERIRQILAEILKKISAGSNGDFFSLAEKKILFTINKNNGIIKKSDSAIAERFNLKDEKEANAVSFFVVCSKNIFEAEEKGIFKKILISSKDILPGIKKVILEAEKTIAEEKKLFTDYEIYKRMAFIFPKISREQIFVFLGVSCNIKKNKFGKWGMIDWMEVSPKGTKERVYLVLKEQGKPMHFTEIAKMIDDFGLGKRKAHPQTVHNELIKDNRFVLVGRGIYALFEWGYPRGTIRDVIKEILEKNKKPLDKKEIISEILKIRKVKETTIMINLNNRNFFEKKGNFYALKNA